MAGNGWCGAREFSSVDGTRAGRQEVEGRTRIQLRKHHVKRGKTRSGEAAANVADRRLRMVTKNEATPSCSN